MLIKSIDLKNFRNYKALHLDLDPGVNVLYGDNAQGKTNLLEAVCVCATSKSHRAVHDREMIGFEQDEAHIRLDTLRDQVPGRIDIHLRKNKSRGIAVGGVPCKKASELFGSLNAVIFSPEDLGLVKNGPAERRRFINMELCQLDQVYVYNLIHYNKALQQRNQLLKDMRGRPELEDTLEFWDVQLMEYGKKLIRDRRIFIRDLGDIIGDLHRDISGSLENLELRYEPSVEEDDFAGMLEKNLEAEKIQRTTLTGPHRDDLSFFINGINIRRYGSQGQQRTAALSLKLAEIALVRRRIGENPVLLLDDVLSELDSNRQENLLGILKGIQTLITCTGLDDFVNHSFHIDRLFRVVDGSVTAVDNSEGGSLTDGQ